MFTNKLMMVHTTDVMPLERLCWILVHAYTILVIIVILVVWLSVGPVSRRPNWVPIDPVKCIILMNVFVPNQKYVDVVSMSTDPISHEESLFVCVENNQISMFFLALCPCRRPVVTEINYNVNAKVRLIMLQVYVSVMFTLGSVSMTVSCGCWIVLWYCMDSMCSAARSGNCMYYSCSRVRVCMYNSCRRSCFCINTCMMHCCVGCWCTHTRVRLGATVVVTEVSVTTHL